jgi:predicted lipoprotein with Yx(FWY)xxD motif
MPISRTGVIAIAVSVAAAAGGVAYAATTGGSGGGYSASGTPPAAAAPSPVNSATVHVGVATVQGKSERILLDARGLPLYTYGHDAAKQSRVTGQLAALWPPLVDATPSASGVGPLTSAVTVNGQQVAYQGHFLYTFVEDSPGRVTGQGVQDFFVATPGTVSVPSAGTPARGGY